MRKYTLLILCLFQTLYILGQEARPLIEGKVSYISLQNIYVKFEQPGIVQPGDSIFIRKDQQVSLLFIAESVSSSSCVGKLPPNSNLKVEDVVLIKAKINKTRQTVLTINTKQQDSIQANKVGVVKKTVSISGREQKISGRLSAASYSSFSNSSDLNQRMRYTFSLTANNIAGSKFSTDAYIMFTHRIDHWDEVKDNLFNALKIYSLSVNYDINPNTHLSVGRKINPRIASIGAIDGLQAETKVKNFTLGAVVGSNPDYTNYSFNPKLFEYGAYIAHELKNMNGPMVNSFAFFQQNNNGNIDRRFVYFQHENSLLKNLNLFISTEIDLYSVKDSVPTNALSLTSLYLSLQYRFSKQLSVFASYDARKNVIYYETFKTYLDFMLEDATRQGYQFRVNYNPSKAIYSNVSAGYRFRKNDPNPSLNANGYLTFPQVPGINASVSLSTNWLKSSYADGMVYGLRIDRDLIPGKLSTALSYRLADYKYPNTNTKSLQHMPEIELSWQIARKTSFSVSYDATFEKNNQYHYAYLSLIKRF